MAMTANDSGAFLAAILFGVVMFFFLGADSGEQEVFKSCARKGEYRTMRGDVIKCEIQRSQP